jgi:hypothetical protein
VTDPVKVIHETLDDGAQTHAGCVAMVIAPVPPPAGAVTLSGTAENVHDAAGSVTTKLLPAIVSVAVLVTEVVFDAAVYSTVPEPVPVVPLEIATQEASLVAVQLHPRVVVTVTVPLPPAVENAWLAGEIVYEQGDAAWVTVNVRPAIVSVPMRFIVPALAAAV